MFGFAAAFLSSSQSKGTTHEHLNQEKIKYVSVGGNLFLAHLQSIAPLLSSSGVKDSKLIASEALANLSFDNDVEQLLDNGWWPHQSAPYLWSLVRTTLKSSHEEIYLYTAPRSLICSLRSPLHREACHAGHQIAGTLSCGCSLLTEVDLKARNSHATMRGNHKVDSDSRRSRSATQNGKRGSNADKDAPLSWR